MQAAEASRKWAKNAGEVMTYLAEFASVSDFSQLSGLFRDDDRLAEAAVCLSNFRWLVHEAAPEPAAWVVTQKLPKT